jgi:hypothetical protein
MMASLTSTKSRAPIARKIGHAPPPKLLEAI